MCCANLFRSGVAEVFDFRITASGPEVLECVGLVVSEFVGEADVVCVPRCPLALYAMILDEIVDPVDMSSRSMTCRITLVR